MKTYIDHNDTINYENIWIPKDPSNIHYLNFLEEVKEKKAKLILKVVTWDEIRQKRNILLKDSDWTTIPDSNPKPSKEDWLKYRQSLRDITTTFKNPQDVVWPSNPLNK